MSMKRLAFLISSTDRNADFIVPALERLSQEHCLTARCSYSLNLVLDEVLTNIFSYAFDDDAPHSALVRIEVGEGRVQLRVEDGGKPFNPLDAPEPAVHLPPELRDKPVGGLGIHLMRKLMDEVSYERREGANVLTMRKNIEHHRNDKQQESVTS
ncbi:MAG: ATP-binding protein [Desulfovibrionaceae bacterium]|jgi:anti-sigma regulatory factor (Ser/Thr protein kinase)